MRDNPCSVFCNLSSIRLPEPVIRQNSSEEIETLLKSEHQVLSVKFRKILTHACSGCCPPPAPGRTRWRPPGTWSRGRPRNSGSTSCALFSDLRRQSVIRENIHLIQLLKTNIRLNTIINSLPSSFVKLYSITPVVLTLTCRISLDSGRKAGSVIRWMLERKYL